MLQGAPLYVESTPRIYNNSLIYFKNKRPTWCHLLFYFTSYMLNMFQTLIYPSSGACDYSVELPHWLYCSWFDVCWGFGVVGLEWYPCCRLQPDLLFFNYHNDARSNKHKLHMKFSFAEIFLLIIADGRFFFKFCLGQHYSLRFFWVSRILQTAVLQPATRIPPQPSHTETPTHIEPRTIQPMW